MRTQRVVVIGTGAGELTFASRGFAITPHGDAVVPAP